MNARQILIIAILLQVKLAMSQGIEELQPSYQTDACSVYEIFGMEIETKLESKVSKAIGPDFIVIYFVTIEGDSIGIYNGGHPSVPYFCSLATNADRWDQKDRYVSMAKENDGHYFKLEESLSTIYDKNDSLIGTKKDSIVWELYVNTERNLWITRPLENQEGQIDIVVEFSGYNGSFFNLFTNSNSQGIVQRLIGIAEKIE